MAHNARKIRHHGDDPAGGTVTQLAEGSNGGSPSGYIRPHRRGTCRRQPGTETGDQDEPCPPTPPFPTPKPNPPAVASLSNASAGPTASPHEAGGDANGEMGSRTMEPPTSLQREHSVTASRYMEDNSAAEERPDQSRNGGSLTMHSGRPALPPAAHPPRRRCHGDGSCLSHQVPGRGGGHIQHLPVPRSLYLGGFGDGATH